MVHPEAHADNDLSQIKLLKAKPELAVLVSRYESSLSFYTLRTLRVVV
jgi:hypothetical protein